MLQGFAAVGHAGEVRLAVAANFTAPMKEIAQRFEKDTNHVLKMSFGGTGQFYAQIVNGAPFDVLLAADQATPEKLIKQDLAVPTTQFTYANGKLALWSNTPDLVDDQGLILSTDHFKRLAMADPKLAPYGQAATDVLDKLGLAHVLRPKIVQGKNIAQAYQFVASGNAQIGFVALSQIYRDGRIGSGSSWVVPDHLYEPIAQDAVLLKAGQHNPAAQSLLAYLQTAHIKALIRSFGYGI